MSIRIYFEPALNMDVHTCITRHWAVIQNRGGSCALSPVLRPQPPSLPSAPSAFLPIPHNLRETETTGIYYAMQYYEVLITHMNTLHSIPHTDSLPHMCMQDLHVAPRFDGVAIRGLHVDSATLIPLMKVPTNTYYEV